jgi:DNA relaxase NicK
MVLNIMEAKYLLDWLSITYTAEQVTALWPSLTEGLSELAFFAPVIAHMRGSFKPQKPRYGYRYVVQSEDGCAVHFTAPGSAQGVHISYSGTAINTVSAIGMLMHHIDQGARVTRLDLAADLIGADLPIDRMFDMMQNRKADRGGPKALTRAQKYTMLSGSTGSTLYIGSRSSSKMLRVYDKRAQMGSDCEPWWRAELEVKGSAAHKAAEIVLERGMGALRGIIKSAAHFPGVPEWEYLTDYAEVIMVKSDQKSRNTRNWMLTHVAKVVAKQCAREEDFLHAFITAVVEHYPKLANDT